MIKGTRILAEDIARQLSQGQTEEQLRHAYPGLTIADIDAVREFACVPARLREAFGGWNDDAAGLEEFIDWNRRRRKELSAEAGG